jgi:hypothetical protein
VGNNLAHDERVKGKEWDLNKRCPVCEDMKAGKITDEGDQVMIPGTDKPFFCPKCGHMEIKFFWRIGAVESARTSVTGQTQLWTHQGTVECCSCDWKKTAGSVPCLGRPWDEIMGDGLDRPEHRSKELQHAIGWSNEHAVGLREGQEKYDAKAKLRTKSYKAKRKIHSNIAEEGIARSDPSTVTWTPNKDEQKMPRFRKKTKKGADE